MSANDPSWLCVQAGGLAIGDTSATTGLSSTGVVEVDGVQGCAGRADAI